MFGQDSSSTELARRIELANVKTRVLRLRLQQCQESGQDIAVPDASLAVAELFIGFSKQDIQIPQRHAIALRSLKYIESMLDAVIAEADDVLGRRSQYPDIPRWNVIGVEAREGGLWIGDEPLFLTGFNWNASMAREQPQMLKRLGVNLVDGMLRGFIDASGECSDTSDDQSYLREMAQQHFAVDAMLSINPPPWLFERHPDLKSSGYGHYVGYAIDHPALIEYRRQCLDHLLPLYRKHKALFAIDLFNEPAFQGTSSYTFANWRRWLTQKYNTIDQVNAAWGTKFISFDAIQSFPTQPESRENEWEHARVDWDKPGVRGMHYDWCAFNKQRVTDFFKASNDQIQGQTPHVSTHVKVMLGNYFTGGTEQRGWPMNVSYHTFGIDVPAISSLATLHGGDDSFQDLSSVDHPNRYFGNASYIANWINSGLSSDLMKSISPDKPFYNSEFHAVEQADVTEIDSSPGGHIKLALWHAHLHGMNANLLWYWGRGVDGAVEEQGQRWFKGSLLDQPWLLNSYSRESLNLRRFVPQVSSFSRQPRRVRLLYSESSAIQEVRAIDTLRDAYEALNFLGISVGFVTERQLAEGGVPDDTRLLIVPDATYTSDETVRQLRSVAKSGVLVRIIGEQSLRMNPVGQRRNNFDIPGAKTLKLDTPQQYQGHFNRWLTEARVSRDLVAVSNDGTPAWGVEVRTAHHGGQRFAYLINLMRDPVTVQLKWSSKQIQFHDLQTNQRVPDLLTLQPRQVILGKY